MSASAAPVHLEVCTRFGMSASAATASSVFHTPCGAISPPATRSARPHGPVTAAVAHTHTGELCLRTWPRFRSPMCPPPGSCARAGSSAACAPSVKQRQQGLEQGLEGQRGLSMAMTLIIVRGGPVRSHRGPSTVPWCTVMKWCQIIASR
jgi:hypothetical protein